MGIYETFLNLKEKIEDLINNSQRTYFHFDIFVGDRDYSQEKFNEKKEQIRITQKFLGKENYENNQAIIILVRSNMMVYGKAESPIVEIEKNKKTNYRMERRTFFLNKDSPKIEEIKNRCKEDSNSSINIIELKDII